LGWDAPSTPSKAITTDRKQHRYFAALLFGSGYGKGRARRNQQKKEEHRRAGMTRSQTRQYSNVLDHRLLNNEPTF